ncbi:MAG: TVP38/TMEM64 family protein [Cellulosilyticaceae bacterium]
MAKNKKNTGKIIGAVVALIALVVILKVTGVFDMLTIDNLQKLKGWIEGFGIAGPIIYLAIYTIGGVAFLPGTPLALLAGIAFGPVLGSFLACLGATMGATLAFLVARYAARNMVEEWASKNTAFQKIDEGVEKQGWRMLMITRLVPLFPYNVQNFAYGLTKIKLPVFILVSFICMLPGAIAFCFMAGAIIAGESITQVMMYFAVGAIFFVGVSLLPGYLEKRKNKKK